MRTGSIGLGRKAATRLGRALAFGVLAVVAVAFVTPFLWILSSSLKSVEQVYTRAGMWIPKPIVWSNYVEAWNYLPFSTYFRNTMVVCILTVIGTLVSCSLVAYSFARIRFPGKKLLFSLLLSTTMLPWAVRIIPVYLMFNRIGWVNTLTPLWFPHFFGNAAYIFLFRQFFMGISRDLTDAARMDGCREFGIYSRIMLPLSGPVLIVVAVFAFLSQWNDFMRPLIYLNDPSKYTMALGLQLFMGLETSRWNLLMAASLTMTIPALVAFAFLQRYMVQGITMTGLKG